VKYLAVVLVWIWTCGETIVLDNHHYNLASKLWLWASAVAIIGVIYSMQKKDL